MSFDVPPQSSEPLPAIAMQPDGRPERPLLVTAIAILDFVAAAFGLVFGGIWAVAGIAGVREDAGAVVLVPLGLIVLLVSALGAAAGVGMLQMRPWGRICQIVVSSVGLVVFCLGTIVNALILAYLLQRKVALIFSGRRVDEMSPGEVQVLAGGRRDGSVGVALIVAAVAGFLAVIAMTGIIAAIAVPNLLNAIQRGKQKRTMGDLRTIATAIEAHAEDRKAYPEAASMSELEAALVPTYAASLPKLDAWTKPFDVASRSDGYVLRSAGKDRSFEETDPFAYTKGPTREFVADIVFADGAFVRWPEGTQK